MKTYNCHFCKDMIINRMLIVIINYNEIVESSSHDLCFDICYDCFAKELRPYYKSTKTGDQQCCFCSREMKASERIGGYFTSYAMIRKDITTDPGFADEQICKACAAKNIHEFTK